MKRLFTEDNENWTLEGANFAQKIHFAMDPILEEYKDYSPRDIGYILFSTALQISLEFGTKKQIDRIKNRK